MTENKWFVIPKPNVHADLKLICFPYAGGSTSTYLSWVNYLPSNVELVIIQAPGRGSRIFEPLYSDMTALTDELVRLIPNVLNKPYIFYGHSLGSRVAFELMDKLSKLKHSSPQHFIASGSRGPHKLSEKKKVAHLPDSEFIDELYRLNGTPKAVIDNKELMDLFLPVLKADFGIAEQYCYSGNTIFECPVSVFGGNEDIDIKSTDLICWQEHFSMKVDLHLISGNHFFVDSNKEVVLQKVNDIITKTLQAPLCIS
ncbi:MAG: medium-chain acyl-[acyl-carrier-protein] hydrolase [Alteromonadaceae bacterium]|jgi:medium-chain acyl-[acyl-carrier-protein] hydrolase